MGERYDVKKPKDSNILLGDGSVTGETEKGIEYVQQKGDRYEIIRPGTSDIWKVSFYYALFILTHFF